MFSVYARDPRARSPFDQNLDRAVGQFQQLQNRGKRADFINLVNIRIIIAGILLRREKDVLIRPHDFFEGVDRFVATNKQRHDHMRKYNDVAQRKDRKKLLTVTDFSCH